jgi:hypothetical protein
MAARYIAKRSRTSPQSVLMRGIIAAGRKTQQDARLDLETRAKKLFERV